MDTPMYQLCFYVPFKDAEKVKNALFEQGAGRIGSYSHCCWQTQGEGQFLAHSGSHPSLGEVGKLEKIAEYKIELVCKADCIEKVIATLKQVHPYETPAYHVYKLECY